MISSKNITPLIEETEVPSGQNTESHKRREVKGMLWDMQILYIKGEGFQATYYNGVDTMMWSQTCIAPEIAALKLDYEVDRLFGKSDYYYVKIGDRLPVAIKGIVNAMEFAFQWNGRLMNPICNP